MPPFFLLLALMQVPSMLCTSIEHEKQQQLQDKEGGDVKLSALISVDGKPRLNVNKTLCRRELPGSRLEKFEEVVRATISEGAVVTIRIQVSRNAKATAMPPTGFDKTTPAPTPTALPQPAEQLPARKIETEDEETTEAKDDEFEKKLERWMSEPPICKKPCIHGGICTRFLLNGKNICSCPIGYMGIQCELLDRQYHLKQLNL